MLYLPHHPLLVTDSPKSRALRRLPCYFRGHRFVLARWEFPDATVICTSCALYTTLHYPRINTPSDTLTDDNPNPESQAIEH